MPLNKVPRTTTQQAPTGYIIGRASPGVGPLEFLNLRDLQQLGVASKADAGAGSTQHGFGFSIQGRPSDGQVIGIAVFPKPMTFTSAATGDAVVSTTPAHASAVFSLLTPVSGVFTQVGTITFAAGSTTGVVAWSGGQYTLAANAQLKMVAPAIQDPALSDISGKVVGVQT
jgi:hypothetical protein